MPLGAAAALLESERCHVCALAARADAPRNPTGGYNAWHRRVLEAIDVATIRSEGYAFQIELKYRAVQAGFRLGETPIVFVERRVGHSKMSLAIVLEAVWRTWRLRAERVGALTPPR